MMKLSTMKQVVETLNDNWESKLANDIANLWDHDKDTVKYFRSSANFIFTFQKRNNRFFLRFNKSSAKSKKELQEEIKLLKALNERKENIVKPVKSVHNNYVETVNTKLGEYNAVVFEEVKGKQFEFGELEKEDFYKWGKELGNLHKCTNEIESKLSFNINSWEDHLFFIENNLPGEETSALEELKRTKDWMYNLNIDDKNYGIIHFDFELDNLIYNNKGFNVIDFDDSAYYWYAADIAFALRDLFAGKVDFKNVLFRAFIKGYESRFIVKKELFGDLPWFLRFHNLLTFTKLIKAVDINEDRNQPDWLIDLKYKLNNVIEEYRKTFEKIN